jgi:hypothetical protein
VVVVEEEELGWSRRGWRCSAGAREKKSHAEVKATKRRELGRRPIEVGTRGKKGNRPVQVRSGRGE